MQRPVASGEGSLAFSRNKLRAERNCVVHFVPND
jgi:hypothetical protein